MARDKKTRIMVFGTFDILHPGHLHFFRQARKLAKNPFLIVSIARDINVMKVKGHKPRFNERSRMQVVRRSQLVDKVVLGGLKEYLPHIVRERPDIIALGYDQRAYVRGLRAALKLRNVPVTMKRLKAHKPRIYKSSKLRYGQS